MNNADDVSVGCAVNIEWLNAQGICLKKVNYKYATLSMIRNGIREMFIQVSTEKQSTPIKLKVANILVHKRFATEGKSSIKFNDENCIIYLSNAPPSILMNFLKILYIKMAGDNGGSSTATNTTTTDKDHPSLIQQNIRSHVLNGAINKYEEISPITNLEIRRAKKLAGVSTTPSPPQQKIGGGTNKRKIDDKCDISGNSSNNESKNLSSRAVGGAADGKSSAAKRLYSSSSSSSLTSETYTLNEEQNNILQACINGKNVFFTGSAGTGKSYLLKKIISTLPPDGTIATASTGVAACLIGGVTLHSFAGIGDGEASLKRCYELASRPVIGQIWRKCRRLIIDEISMVDGQFFDKIESVARHIRRNDKPFGGIQLILCGDFFQLPPVTKIQYENGRRVFTTESQEKRFCFQAKSWSNVINVSYELKHVHRQKDEEFVKILNFIRIGHINAEITKRLLATSSQKIEQNGILATQLCSHTNDANLINTSKLEKLTGEQKTFDAQDSDAASLKQLDAQVPAPGKLTIKIGAQVMLLKNINVNEGLVNGARGIVVRYDQEIPVVKFRNNREYVVKPEKWIIKNPNGTILVRRQIPLKLAWAFSIHKSQGLTLDCVEMSLAKVFEAGQAYVALSRAQSLASIRVLDFDAKQVWANPDVLQFYKLFRRQLQDITYIPLGGRGDGSGSGANRLDDKNKVKKITKLTKSLMDKPLVNIS